MGKAKDLIEQVSSGSKPIDAINEAFSWGETRRKLNVVKQVYIDKVIQMLDSSEKEVSYEVKQEVNSYLLSAESSLKDIREKLNRMMKVR